MPSLPATFAEDVINQPARAQFEAFLDEHRGELNRCLDGLTEEQARQSLVPSRTTLLGLVKHATRARAVSERCRNGVLCPTESDAEGGGTKRMLGRDLAWAGKAVNRLVSAFRLCSPGEVICGHWT